MTSHAITNQERPLYKHFHTWLSNFAGMMIQQHINDLEEAQSLMQADFMTLDKKARKNKILNEMIRIQTHRDKKEDFHCTMCEKKFTRGDTAVDHFEAQHLRLGNYQCHICQNWFHSNGQKRSHIHNDHIKPKT